MADVGGCSEEDFILVLDFECAWDAPPVPREEEIIEFPSVLMRGGKVVDEIQMYVRTEILQQIHPETTAITGITQEQVSGGLRLDAALAKHEEWLRGHGVVGQGGVKTKPLMLATCGDFDGRMIQKQAKRMGLVVPPYLSEWVNIKEVYRYHFKKRGQKGMAGMLKEQGLELQGRHHSGIDDCRNLAGLVA
eukprot:CAMPEP_0119127530 /NCGR_PEP_ID=MMETSP1310-20130426/6049_1 /TAXON_ID=464262 /ORGANISM="Genus nov. species nov., Strain RCC2339" /LENGTH=190 /DNA_ID=CAMNT_0007117801 /DNA_START=99 /DNA_END=667 /DNA_ORIENTATION=-